MLDASTLTLEQFGQYAEDGIPVIITGLDMTAQQPWDLPFINVSHCQRERGRGRVWRATVLVQYGCALWSDGSLMDGCNNMSDFFFMDVCVSCGSRRAAP